MTAQPEYTGSLLRIANSGDALLVAHHEGVGEHQDRIRLTGRNRSQRTFERRLGRDFLEQRFNPELLRLRLDDLALQRGPADAAG